MATKDDLNRIARLAHEAAEQAAQGNLLSLAPLFQQMQALGEVLPGLHRERLEESLARDAEIEAGFDNMPV
ncbi:hypothetical protein [Pseudotabrizicola algicola]|uniref:Uncharacterized protein n=1 Tax=Pseudotabrizicola algicola TaxID=2709381 RepID=A0A6B3RNY5_9RHOB|nr:hypothetical protein [Pseudotabrizicola algicola]NEX44799.1 hypothetical protein [Pseudotabrizicola algicola]